MKPAIALLVLALLLSSCTSSRSVTPPDNTALPPRPEHVVLKSIMINGDTTFYEQGVVVFVRVTSQGQHNIGALVRYPEDDVVLTLDQGKQHALTPHILIPAGDKVDVRVIVAAVPSEITGQALDLLGALIAVAITKGMLPPGGASALREFITGYAADQATGIGVDFLKNVHTLCDLQGSGAALATRQDLADATCSVAVEQISGNVGDDRILAPPAYSADESFDFMLEAPHARWESISPGGPNIPLAFPGLSGDFRPGFALAWEGRRLEDGNVYPVVLGTHPKLEKNGGIRGIYTLKDPIKQGDLFTSHIGYLAGMAPEVVCRWTLAYYDEHGVFQILDAVEKPANGQIVPFNVPLQDLVGKQPELLLFVSRVGLPRDFEPIWIAPKIVHRGQA